MKTHSPAFLSLGSRRKKNSKGQNENTSFTQGSWSDMPMTGKCELCERGRGRHARRRAPVRAGAPELQAPGRRLRSTSGRPCATCVSSKPGYTLASEMKNYTERDAWFLLTILKRSLSLILGKILCLSIFPLWQTQPSRAGLKGFCPGQMVEHKNPADSRNNLKKREEISLNRYGSAKINGYSSSLDKTLLHFFSQQISDAIDQGAY